MKAEVKEKWLTALRSDEFQQAQGMLQDTENHFCCLGVLCELYRRETGGGAWRPDGVLGGYNFDTGCTNFAGYPPSPVCDWAGLDDYVVRDASGYELASHNDEGKSFKEIADIIERDL